MWAPELCASSACTDHRPESANAETDQNEQLGVVASAILDRASGGVVWAGVPECLPAGRFGGG